MLYLKKFLWFFAIDHIILTELAKKFEGGCSCLGENTEKYETFSVPITKEVKNLLKLENKLKKPYPTKCNYW